MSDLSFAEKSALERQFDMGSGYVLDFSHRTLGEFVLESTGRNIFSHDYDRASGSKANRLRAFWSREPNHVVGKLLADLLDYCRPPGGATAPDSHFEVCQRIVDRLREGGAVEAIDAVVPADDGREFEVLARSVRLAIDRNEPEAGLDHLHTYVTKLIRGRAERRGVDIAKEKPLHSVFGEYVRHLRTAGLLETDMTERILKSTISTLEAFSAVRNSRSLAHDNVVLTYHESLFIYSNVCSTVRFIRALEDRPNPSGSEDSLRSAPDTDPPS